MRSTFWQNRIFEHQSCQFVTLASNSLQNGQTVRFSWKLYKTLFSGHAQHVLAKSNLWASNFSKSLHLSQILFKTGKQCAFLENCTKRSFQVMRSTFCQNRICESESCQNHHTGLKFSPKRENSALFMKIVGHAQHVLAKSHFWARKLSIRHTGLKFSSKRPNSALFMKIVQNALFRSCAARFGQIKFVSVKVLKIVTLASNSLQNGKTGRVSWKLYKTLVSVLAKSHLWGSKLSKSSRWPPQNGQTVRFSWKLYKFLFSGHAEHVLAKSHFRASKLSKSLHLSQILFKTGKQCAFLENCTKRSYQVMRSTFWPNQICERQTSQNPYTCPKFSSKRENSALFLKIVQNALFRSCGARFAKIAFVRVKVVKIITLASNSLQNGKTVRFSWKF